MILDPLGVVAAITPRNFPHCPWHRAEGDALARHPSIDMVSFTGSPLALGGPNPPAGPDRGFYVRPTVFGEVKTDMVIAQEEIFGPVLAVMSYHSEDQAADIANGTSYGLTGAVWSADPEHAATFARRLRTGRVDLNGGRFNPLAPFGGFGHSGIGREYGSYGLREFCEPKSLQS